MEMGSWRGFSKPLPSRYKSHSPDKNDQYHKNVIGEADHLPGMESAKLHPQDQLLSRDAGDRKIPQNEG